MYFDHHYKDESTAYYVVCTKPRVTKTTEYNARSTEHNIERSPSS